jgi:hypothetical protein
MPIARSAARDDVGAERECRFFRVARAAAVARHRSARIRLKRSMAADPVDERASRWFPSTPLASAGAMHVGAPAEPTRESPRARRSSIEEASRLLVASKEVKGRAGLDESDSLGASGVGGNGAVRQGKRAVPPLSSSALIAAARAAASPKASPKRAGGMSLASRLRAARRQSLEAESVSAPSSSLGLGSLAVLSRFRSAMTSREEESRMSDAQVRQLRALRAVKHGLLAHTYGWRGGEEEGRGGEDPPSDEEGRVRGRRVKGNDERSQPQWASRRGLDLAHGAHSLLNAPAPVGPFSSDELTELADKFVLHSDGQRKRRPDLATVLADVESGMAALGFAREVEEEEDGRGASRGSTRLRRKRRASLTRRDGPTEAVEGAMAIARRMAEALAGSSSSLAAAASSALLIAAPLTVDEGSITDQVTLRSETAAALSASAAAVSKSPVQAYLRFCAASRKEPARHLLRQLLRPSIMLSGRAIGTGHATHAYALAASIPLCEKLVHLDLSNNCLTDAAASALCRAAAMCPGKVVTLDLADNCLTVAAMSHVASIGRRVEFLGLGGQSVVGKGIDGLGVYALVAGLLAPSESKETPEARPQRPALRSTADARPHRPAAPAPLVARRPVYEARYAPPLWVQDEASLRYGVPTASSMAALSGGIVLPPAGEKPMDKSLVQLTKATARAAAPAKATGADASVEYEERVQETVASVLQQLRVATLFGPNFGGPPIPPPLISPPVAIDPSVQASRSHRHARRLSTRMVRSQVANHSVSDVFSKAAPLSSPRRLSDKLTNPATTTSTPRRSAATHLMKLPTSLSVPARCSDIRPPPALPTIPKQPVLKELDLSRCSLTDRSAAPLARLAAVESLESLDLAWNDLGSTGVLPLLRCLVEPRCALLPVAVLASPCEDLGETRSAISCSLWRAARNACNARIARLRKLLTRLAAGGKAASAKGSDKLADIPKIPCTPFESVFGGAPVPVDLVVASMRAAPYVKLPGKIPSSQMRTLSLAFCGLDDQIAPILSVMLSGESDRDPPGLPSLTNLDLSSNRLTERTGRTLAKALSSNRSLVSLRVGFNPLGKLATLAIIHAIDANTRVLATDVGSGGVAASGMKSASGAATVDLAASQWVIGGNSTLTELGLENTCAPLSRHAHVPPALIAEISDAIVSARDLVAQQQGGKAAASKESVPRETAMEVLHHMMPGHFGYQPTVRIAGVNSTREDAPVIEGGSMLSLDCPVPPPHSPTVDWEAGLMEDKTKGLERLRGSRHGGLILPDEPQLEVESLEAAVQDVWEEVQRVLERRSTFAFVSVEYPEQSRVLGGRVKFTTNSKGKAGGGEDGADTWSREQSVFRPRLFETDSQSLFDTPELMNRCFESDWASTKVQRVVPVAEQRAAMKPVLKQWYPVLREVFRLYCSASNADSFSLSFNLWTDLRRDMGIASREKDALLDNVFVATNVELEADDENPDHSLCRFEFVEVIVRAALILYPVGAGESGPAASIEALLTRHVAPAAVRMLGIEDLAEPFSNQFRLQQLYTKDVDDVFRSFLRQLQVLFRRFSEREFDTAKPFMGIRHWIDFLTASAFLGATRLGNSSLAADVTSFEPVAESKPLSGKIAVAPAERLTERDARSLFLFSNPTVVDELHRSVRARRRFRHTHLTFTSFLEALARLASSHACPTNLPPSLVPVACAQAERVLQQELALRHGVAAARSHAARGGRGRGNPRRSVEDDHKESASSKNPWPLLGVPPEDLPSRLVLTLAQCCLVNDVSLRGVPLLPMHLPDGDTA